MTARTPNDGVRIVLVYSSLLGIYGDRGNAMVLARRLEWRGERARLLAVEPGQMLPDDGDIYLLGGGEDAAQVSAANALRTDGAINRAVERGAVVLAVCAGYQIAGHRFTDGNGVDHAGLGVLDVVTERAPTRAVGEIASYSDTLPGEDGWLTGFENHGGVTRREAAAHALGRVHAGVGNGDGTDGAVTGRVYGTYAHGPVLARNPALADHLLEVALGRPLAPLACVDVDLLRAERLAKAGVTEALRLSA